MNTNTAMSDALKNVSAPVPAARQGVSLADLMAKLEANEARHAAEMAEMNARLESAKSQSVKIIRVGSNDGKPWYERTFAGMFTKGPQAGKPKFTINHASIKTTDECAIALNVGPARQFGVAVLIVKGKRKPVYLSASTLGALIGASGMLTAFQRENTEAISAAFVAETDTDE